MNAPFAPPLRLTAEQAEQAREIAWQRYWNTPHTDLRVGRERYRRAIAEIEKLEAHHD